MASSFKLQASGFPDQVASVGLEAASFKLDKLQAVGYNRIMKVRSKHNDLLNYFIHDERDLSPAYLASCRKFFKDIEQRKGIKFSGKFKPRSGKPQASSNRHN